MSLAHHVTYYCKWSWWTLVHNVTFFVRWSTSFPCEMKLMDFTSTPHVISLGNEADGFHIHTIRHLLEMKLMDLTSTSNVITSGDEAKVSYDIIRLIARWEAGLWPLHMITFVFTLVMQFHYSPLLYLCFWVMPSKCKACVVLSLCKLVFLTSVIHVLYIPTTSNFLLFPGKLGDASSGTSWI